MSTSFSRLFKGLNLLALTMVALSAVVLLGTRAAGASSLSDSLAQANANAGPQHQGLPSKSNGYRHDHPWLTE